MKKAILALFVGYISMIAIVSNAYARTVNLCDWQLDGNIAVNSDYVLLTNAAGKISN